MDQIIVITGPTGVGKTKLSIMLAKVYGAEIINADSMQVYRRLNIGTAKVTKEEKSGVKHHLLDIKSVLDDYSVYDYQKDCRKKIKEIHRKGKPVIIVGGTGLYIKAALYDYQFSRDELKDNQYSDLTNDEIYKRILYNEPDAIVDKKNRRRLIRYLNKIDKDLLLDNKTSKLIYDNVTFIGLKTDTEELYNRINTRVDNMLIDLVDEVKGLYQDEIRSKSVMTGIGYKELYEFFEDEKSFKEAVELIKKNSRNYAKRQYTWFNNQMDITWFDVDFNNFNNTFENVIDYLNSK